MEEHPIDWRGEIAGARSRLGVTIAQLARQLGVLPSELGAIERGQLLPDEEFEARLKRCLRPGSP